MELPPTITAALIWSAGMISGMVVGTLIAYNACRRGIREAILQQQRKALEMTFTAIARTIPTREGSQTNAPTLH